MTGRPCGWAANGMISTPEAGKHGLVEEYITTARRSALMHAHVQSLAYVATPDQACPNHRDAPKLL